MRQSIYLMLFILLAPVMTSAADDQADIHRIELIVKDREVQGEQDTVRVTQGEDVELVWQSDESAILHLHGYDIEFELSPEDPTIVRFNAHATGRFPVTSHGFSQEQPQGHAALLYIEVYPD